MNKRTSEPGNAEIKLHPVDSSLLSDLLQSMSLKSKATISGVADTAEVKQPSGLFNVMGDKGFLADFAYGGSQFGSKMTSCVPDRHYDPKKMQYNDSMLRALPIEVRVVKDTSVAKGDEGAIWNPTAANDGHVSRLVRMFKELLYAANPTVYDMQPKLVAGRFSLDFQVTGCHQIDEVYVLWQNSFSENIGQGVDIWKNAVKITIPTAGMQPFIKNNAYRIVQEIPNLNMTHNIDFKVVVQCDKTYSAVASDTPTSIYGRSKTNRQSSLSKNSVFSLPVLNEATYEIFQLVPNKLPSLLFLNTDNKQLFFFNKEQPLTLLASENLKDLQSSLTWSEAKGGYVFNLRTNLVSDNSPTVRVFKFHDHNMGPHLSEEFYLEKKVENNVNVYTSKEAIGDMELVGKMIYLKYSNRKIPFVSIFSQTETCLQTSNQCFGVPLRSYGLVVLHRDTEILKIYIKQEAGNKFTFIGKIKASERASFVTPGGQFFFKMAGVELDARVEPDKDGDFGFLLKAEMTQANIKLLGQVLLVRQTNLVYVPLGISNLNADRIPYSPSLVSNFGNEDLPIPAVLDQSAGLFAFVGVLLGLAMLTIVVYSLCFSYKTFRREQKVVLDYNRGLNRRKTDLTQEEPKSDAEDEDIF